MLLYRKDIVDVEARATAVGGDAGKSKVVTLQGTDHRRGAGCKIMKFTIEADGREVAGKISGGSTKTITGRETADTARVTAAVLLRQLPSQYPQSRRLWHRRKHRHGGYGMERGPWGWSLEKRDWRRKRYGRKDGKRFGTSLLEDRLSEERFRSFLGSEEHLQYIKASGRDQMSAHDGRELRSGTMETRKVDMLYVTPLMVTRTVPPYSKVGTSPVQNQKGTIVPRG